MEAIPAMGNVPYAAAVGVALFVYVVIYPLVVYFKDPKGKPSNIQIHHQTY